MKKIKVVEMFLALQGEGALMGHPTVFVRTGGCGYRCSWCDSLHAVLPEFKDAWKPMSAEEILAEAEKLAGGPCLITLSGGDPAIQPMEHLILLGQTLGFTFAMETQGQVAPDWLEHLDYLIVSPKPPSSEMATNWKKLHEVIGAGLAGKPKLSLKVVVMDDVDFAYAEMVHEMFPPVEFYVSAGNRTPPAKDGTGSFDLIGTIARAKWLAELIMERQHPDMRLTVQLHSWLWGNDRGR